MSGLVCPHCGEKVDLFGANGGREEALRQEIPFLGAIPIDPAAREAGDSGTPYVLESPSSQVAESFGGIADKIVELLHAGA